MVERNYYLMVIKINEITGVDAVVSVEITRMFRIEPWMLILILMIFILFSEFKRRKLK